MQKVLVVDDEKEIRDMLSICLKKEGFTSISCECGMKALEIMEIEEIDLIILDIMMEDVDGFTVLQQLRKKHEDIPVIFLSARQEEYDKVLGLGLGADDYVTKPFSPGELMARVKVQLRKKNKMQGKCTDEQYLVYKNIKMDLKSYRVTVGTREVELVGKELLLLKFFLENPNQVFTKTQIYHQVWDDTYEDDNTVMVYISHLREKIEDNPKEPQILVTIRGIGYRFGKE